MLSGERKLRINFRRHWSIIDIREPLSPAPNRINMNKGG
jgi:hypothetical protein